MKDESISCKSDVSRLNRNNAHLIVENKNLKAEVTRLKAEVEKLGGSKVEKDSTNSCVPPTQQSIAGQAVLLTHSLREPSAGQAVVRKDTPVMNWPEQTILRRKRNIA